MTCDDILKLWTNYTGCSKPDSTVRLITTSTLVLDGTVLLHQMQNYIRYVLSTMAMNYYY
jgi:hypothetical protein